MLLRKKRHLCQILMYLSAGKICHCWTYQLSIVARAEMYIGSHLWLQSRADKFCNIKAFMACKCPHFSTFNILSSRVSLPFSLHCLFIFLPDTFYKPFSKHSAIYWLQREVRRGEHVFLGGRLISVSGSFLMRPRKTWILVAAPLLLCSAGQSNITASFIRKKKAYVRHGQDNAFWPCRWRVGWVLTPYEPWKNSATSSN